MTKPSISARNLTPSSTALPSPASATPMVGVPHRLQGQVPGAAVVKLQETSAASALPARSLMRGSVAPPCRRAVKTVSAGYGSIEPG